MSPEQTALINKLASHFEAESFVFNRGIERETLRVDEKGNLAQTPHPNELGSKLTHPTVTTDFSEAQLELITPVSQSIEETLKTLEDIHRFVYANVGDEILWASSMPCILHGSSDIPLARYGDSNLGKLKTCYRNGLGIRYGRSMQTICAVHYNFSFSETLWQGLSKMEGRDNNSDYQSERYFDLMRNFRRFSWLPIFLTGASPAISNSFVKGQKHNLEKFDEDSLYFENATSLRNGDDLGYKSVEQSELIDICYNGLENYVRSLAKAVTTPVERYTEMSAAEDHPVQVNDSVLQSEAEFYTTIRAKRVPEPGDNFLKTMLDDGVQYIEVRLLDVNPYAPLGVDEKTMRFIDVFLLHCLLIESPNHGDLLCRSVNENVVEVVSKGRDTNTVLNDNGVSKSIDQWGGEILNELMVLAKYLDEVNGGNAHQESIQHQLDKLKDPSLTPSGKILADMEAQAIPFFKFSMNQSLAHKKYFLDKPLSPEENAHFEAIANKSIQDQISLEKEEAENTDLPFKTYLENLSHAYHYLSV